MTLDSRFVHALLALFPASLSALFMLTLNLVRHLVTDSVKTAYMPTAPRATRLQGDSSTTCFSRF